MGMGSTDREQGEGEGSLIRQLEQGAVDRKGNRKQ